MSPALTRQVLYHRASREALRRQFFYAQDSRKPEDAEGPKFHIENNCNSDRQEKRKAKGKIN